MMSLTHRSLTSPRGLPCRRAFKGSRDSASPASSLYMKASVPSERARTAMATIDSSCVSSLHDQRWFFSASTNDFQNP